MRLVETALAGPLSARLSRPPGRDLRLWWLGQAGFVVEGEGRRVVIDPYLSDSLAEKYRGTKFPHIRMMPAPVAAHEIAHVDLVLATHAHTDHLDPGTLPVLMAASPGTLLVAPKAARAIALERSGIGPERLVCMDAGETLTVAGLRLSSTRSAHETLERDATGNHRFLGFALTLAGRTVFHCGDTIPFEGQAAEVRALKADLALFPVNGRDAQRAGNGVPGNMTIAEALGLAHEAGIGAMIAHHFGLFDFNTVPRASVEAAAAASPTPHAVAARTEITYSLGA